MEGHERPNDKNKKNFFFLKQNKKYQHTPEKKSRGWIFPVSSGDQILGFEKKKRISQSVRLCTSREKETNSFKETPHTSPKTHESLRRKRTKKDLEVESSLEKKFVFFFKKMEWMEPESERLEVWTPATKNSNWLVVVQVVRLALSGSGGGEEEGGDR